MNPAERLYPEAMKQLGDNIVFAAQLEAMKDKMRKETLRDLGDAQALIRLAEEKIVSAISSLPVSDDSSSERLGELANAVRALRSQMANTCLVMGR